MKKILFSMTAIAIASLATAQVKLGFQLHGGTGWAGLNKQPDVSSSKKPIASFGGGIVASWPINEQFELSGSLNYLRKGLKMNSSTTDLDMVLVSNAKARLDYAELPLQLAYRIASGNKFYTIALGPSVGYGFKGNAVNNVQIRKGNTLLLETTDELDPFKKQDGETDHLNRWDFSGMASAGVEFNNGLYVKLNYLHGFSDLQTGTDKYRNRTAFLSVGYFFKSKPL